MPFVQPIQIEQKTPVLNNVLGLLGTIQQMKKNSRESDIAEQQLKNSQIEHEQKQTKFKQDQDAYARLNSTDSPEAKLVKSDAQGFLQIIGNSSLGQKNPGAFKALNDVVNDPNTTGLAVKSAFEQSPLVKSVTALVGKDEGLAAAFNKMAAQYGNREQMQQERIDNSIHQKTVARINSDPQLKARLGQYQNLDNALATITQADVLTPQQIDEFQQAVRGNIGIKGAGGVGEREHTYFNSLGLDASRWSQFLTGNPADIAKDSHLVHHLQNIAKVEQANISKQMDSRLKAVTAGNSSMYSRRPDLRADLMDAVSANLDQIKQPQNANMPQGGPGVGGVSEQEAHAGKQAAPSPEIMGAMQFIRDNPNDPRTPQIKDKLRMMGF